MTFRCFGTRCAVLVDDRAAAALARRRLAAWHDRFSRFRPDSELSRLNADPRSAVPVSPVMARLVEAVVAAARLTDGLVDATLVHEIEAAGYRGDLGAPLLPALALRLAPPRTPARRSAASRWREIRVRDGVVHRPPGLAIDSGGLAKGLFADLIAESLPHAALAVDCGGDLRFRGPERRIARGRPVRRPGAARVRAVGRRRRHHRHPPAQLARRARPARPPPPRPGHRAARLHRRRAGHRARAHGAGGGDPGQGRAALRPGRGGRLAPPRRRPGAGRRPPDHPRGGGRPGLREDDSAGRGWHRDPVRLPSILIAALVAAGVAASPAAADSIVYVKQGNLYLTSPDGSQGYQLTSDGGYSSPSQAADGTIGALHDDQMVRLDRAGHVLSAVDGIGSGNDASIGGPYEPRISPDGTRFAYYFYVQTSFDDYEHAIRWIDTGSYSTWTYADHFTSPATESEYERSLEQPEWVTNDRLLGTLGMYLNMWTWKLGTGHGYTYPAAQWWFGLQDPPDEWGVAAYHWYDDPALSPDGSRLAMTDQGRQLVVADTHGPAWSGEPPYAEVDYVDPVSDLQPPAIRCRGPVGRPTTPAGRATPASSPTACPTAST